jgi:hypothetical protein
MAEFCWRITSYDQVRSNVGQKGGFVAVPHSGRGMVRRNFVNGLFGVVG